MSCNYRNREKVKNIQNEGFFLQFLKKFKIVYLDVKKSNLISIFVPHLRNDGPNCENMSAHQKFQLKSQNYERAVDCNVHPQEDEDA